MAKQAIQKSTTSDNSRAADTRERLLDAAERLFAERGYSGVSTREITEAASVNSAAAHYHFGSKLELLRAVFARRLEPLNSHREKLIEEALQSSKARPDIAEILKAFIEPTLELGGTEGERNFRALAAHASMDPAPEVRGIVFEIYHSVGQKFVDALQRACANLTREEFAWRVACVYGAMLYIRGNNGRIQRLLGDDISFSDPSEAIAHVIPFLTAGMSLPPVSPKGKSKGKSRPTGAR